MSNEMTPEEAADLWFEANPPPPLTDRQVTVLRSLFGLATHVPIATPPREESQ